MTDAEIIQAVSETPTLILSINGIMYLELDGADTDVPIDTAIEVLRAHCEVGALTGLIAKLNELRKLCINSIDNCMGF